MEPDPLIAFLDTDVLVDCLRGTSAARAWAQEAASEGFQVPGIVAMELVVGCRNQSDLQRCREFLGTFPLVWPDASESARAYELLATYKLSSGLSIPDCLIAAMTLARSVRLYTRNLKHFRIVPGLDVQEPYSRT